MFKCESNLFSYISNEKKCKPVYHDGEFTVRELSDILTKDKRDMYNKYLHAICNNLEVPEDNHYSSYANVVNTLAMNSLDIFENSSDGRLSADDITSAISEFVRNFNLGVHDGKIDTSESSIEILTTIASTYPINTVNYLNSLPKEVRWDVRHDLLSRFYDVDTTINCFIVGFVLSRELDIINVDNPFSINKSSWINVGAPSYKLLHKIAVLDDNKGNLLM